MTAGADFDDPKFLEAFVICDTHQLAMAGKLLFPILSAVLATACLVNLQPRRGRDIVARHAESRGQQRKTGHGDMEWEEALLVAWGGESPLRTSGFFGGKRHEPGGSPKG